LQYVRSGDGVAAPLFLGGGQIGHTEFFIGAEAAQSFILKMDGNTNRGFEFVSEIADFFYLRAFGVVHVQGQPDNNSFDVFPCYDISEFVNDVFCAVENGKR